MTRLRTGRPEAAAAIWTWRDRSAPLAPGASASRMRLKGMLQAGVGAGVGLVFHWVGWPRLAGVAFVLAAGVGLAALVSPTGLYAGLQRLFEATGRAVGRIMTWVMMVPLFYLFFLPFGRLLRRGRRDRLKRFFDAEVASYWEPHPELTPASHERQY